MRNPSAELESGAGFRYTLNLCFVDLRVIMLLIVILFEGRGRLLAMEFYSIRSTNPMVATSKIFCAVRELACELVSKPAHRHKKSVKGKRVEIFRMENTTRPLTDFLAYGIKSASVLMHSQKNDFLYIKPINNSTIFLDFSPITWYMLYTDFVFL